MTEGESRDVLELPAKHEKYGRGAATTRQNHPLPPATCCNKKAQCDAFFYTFRGVVPFAERKGGEKWRARCERPTCEHIRTGGCSCSYVLLPPSATETSAGFVLIYAKQKIRSHEQHMQLPHPALDSAKSRLTGNPVMWWPLTARYGSSVPSMFDSMLQPTMLTTITIQIRLQNLVFCSELQTRYCSHIACHFCPLKSKCWFRDSRSRTSVALMELCRDIGGRPGPIGTRPFQFILLSHLHPT